MGMHDRSVRRFRFEMEAIDYRGTGGGGGGVADAGKKCWSGVLVEVASPVSDIP